MEEPLIRPASNEDSGAVTQLVFSVLREYGLEPDPEDTDADLKDIEANYAGSGGRFDVLENSGGEIIGCAGLASIGNGVCVLRKMYLHREYRGRGFGKKLLIHAIDAARELGFRRINLETASMLSEAVALYRRFGFRPFDDPGLPERCDGAYYLELDDDENKQGG